MPPTAARCPRAPRAIRRRARSLHLVALAAAATTTFGAAVTVALPSSAEVPAGWRDVAHDSFGRTLSGQWGTADAGGSYALSASGSTASTSGSTGVATLNSGSSFGATLAQLSVADVDLSDTVRLDAGSAQTYDVFASWAVRQQGAGSAYTSRVRITNSGKATLAVARKNASTTTTLASFDLPFTVKAGQSVRGELQTTGTSPVMVRARVWLTGQSRPAWQVQHTDSSSSRLQGKGTVGVWSYASAASAQLKILRDDLSVGSPSGVSTGSPVAAPPAPVTPPVAPAPVTTSGSRGTTVGSATYPAPSGAVFVDVKSGSDSSPGTQGSPLRTASAAVAKAPSGGTIVLRSGTYHEQVTVPNAKKLTIQNYPGEAVWFDGSVPVTSWTKSGSTWVSSGWKAKFDSSMGGDSTFKARFIKNNPMAADPDQVFVNGGQLKQVASASAVVAGTFAVDDAGGRLIIGTDPAGKDVRASDLGQAFSISGAGSVLQGIGVRRYATTYQQFGAVRVSNVGGTVRHVVMTDNAMAGLSLSNSNKVIDHVVSTNNGMLGIGGTQDDNSVIQNSVINGNNTQDFKDAPVSGGIKLTRSRGITVSNSEVKNNQSAGIWFDASCYNIKVVGNDAQYNRSSQIELEVSDTGIVANNTAFGGTTGILIYDTGNVKIYNNEVGNSSTFGITLQQDARRQADPTVPEAHDPRAPIPDPTVTWITKNVVVANNVFGNGGYFQFYALDRESNRTADSMNITVNGNLFNKRVNKDPSQPTMVAWGQGDNHTLVRYETPAEFKAKNSSWVNAQAPGSYKITDMAGLKSQYASTALPLPSDVAVAAGLPAGSQKLGRY